MGVWGYGNFESDDSLNLLSALINQIRDKIRQVFALGSQNFPYRHYGDAHIVAHIDILGTLLTQYRIFPDLSLEEVSGWKTQYLNIYNNITSNYKETESIEFATKRRRVIEDTFDRLLTVMKEIFDNDGFEDDGS